MFKCCVCGSIFGCWQGLYNHGLLYVNDEVVDLFELEVENREAVIAAQVVLWFSVIKAFVEDGEAVQRIGIAHTARSDVPVHPEQDPPTRHSSPAPKRRRL